MSWVTNVQWKGTDLTMDFVCPDCGKQSLVTGMFAAAIRCPFCRSAYVMPTDLPLRRANEGEVLPTTVVATPRSVVRCYRCNVFVRLEEEVWVSGLDLWLCTDGGPHQPVAG